MISDDLIEKLLCTEISTVVSVRIYEKIQSDKVPKLYKWKFETTKIESDNALSRYLSTRSFLNS